MSASKFWRVVGLATWRDGQIALAALHLYAAGIRVDESASVSVAGVPAEEALLLKQSEFTEQEALLLEPTLGLAVVWEFEAAVDIDTLVFAVGDGAGIEGFAVEHCDDGLSWERRSDQSGLIEPATFTLHAVPLTADIDSDLILPSGSGSSSDMSRHLSPVTVYGVTPTVGLHGQALAFEQSSGLVYSYLPRALPGGTYWIEAWIKPVLVSGWRPILTLTAPFAGQFGSLIFVVTDGRLMLEVRPATGVALRSIVGGVVTANTWSHVAVSVKNGAAKLFVNGALVASGTTVLDIAFTPVGIGVGTAANRNNPSVEYFGGVIDGLRFSIGHAGQESDFTPTAIQLDLVSRTPLLRQNTHGVTIVSLGAIDEHSVHQAASVPLDVEFSGAATIHGTVELYAQAGNIPLPRRVRLYRSRDGLLVRETWSNAQGEYRFDGITDRYTYDVIAWDHEGLQRSVVANDLTPEVMP